MDTGRSSQLTRRVRYACFLQLWHSPLEVLFGVLVRLPAKELCRLRIVCPALAVADI
ncbi:hypothetical protein EE612_038131 [Oryza sativa]|nr:hypothetical protein EE612_038131 [Oryza sativa]